MTRATKRTVKLEDEIIERLSEGEPLRKICRDEHMPEWRTVYDWLRTDKDLSARFAHARDIGFDAIAEEALLIADETQEGVRTEESENGIKQVKEDMLGHRKLRIETRLKLLAKWCPRRFGEKLELSGDPDRPIGITEIKRTIVDA